MNEKNTPYALQGDHMRRIREARGITRKKLSEISDIPINTIYCLEHGMSAGSIPVVKELANTLKVSIDEYVGNVRRK